ncbi:MAG: VOC family protein [Thiohalomonadales bacterium]
MILSYHHIQITIPIGAEDIAREFYGQVLGLVEIEKPQALKKRGGLWFQLGDLQLHIGTEDGVDRHKTKAHIAYRVSDVSHWKNKMIGLNISVTDGISIPNVERIDFRDPFGNKVEMMQVL